MPAGSNNRVHPFQPSLLIAPTVLGLLLACAGGGSSPETTAAAPSAQAPIDTTATTTAGVTVTPGTATVAAGATQAFAATVSGTSGSALNWTVDGIANGSPEVGTLAVQPSSGVTLRKAYYQAKASTQTISVQAGDLVIVGWVVGNSPDTTTCVDSAGNTYRPIATRAYSSAINATAYAFYTIAQSTNSALNVAIKSVNPNNVGIFVQVVAGAKPDPATVLEAAATKSETSRGTSHASSSLTTAAAGDYVFTLWTQNYTGTSLAEKGTGFTIANKDNAGNAGSYRSQVPAGAVAEKVTTGRSVAMGSIIAAFKPASTGNSAIYTAPANGGVHTVAASSSAASGSAVVTVQAAAPSAPVTVTLSPATASVLEGGTVSLAATVANASNTAVNWTVDGIAGGNASVGLVSGTGSGAVYTAPVTAGTHTVTATSAVSATAFASAAITVTAPAPAPVPVTLSQSPATASLTAGQSVTITANVSGTTNTGVTWKVDGVANGNSTVGAVSGTGNSVTYTAPAAAGNHTVTATSVADSSAAGSTAVTVQAATNGTSGSTTAVALAPATPTALGSGASVTFTASATGSTGDTFTWSVDGVAGGNSTVGTIAGGVYTAPSSSAKALHTIKATSVSNPSASASVRVLTVASNATVNAKTQYGATGNGSTDDTAALQRALSAAGSGICYVPAGTYLVNPAATGNQFCLTVPAGATLLLDPAAVLKLKTFTGSGGYGGVLLNGSNAALVGGTIVGDRVARNLGTYIDGSGTDFEEGQGVQASSGASNLFIIGVTSRDNCCDGFYFAGNVGNVLVSDCVADNNRRQGSSLVYCHDITFQYSVFRNTNGNDPACGIDLEPNAGSTVTRVSIDNCAVYGNVGGGIAGGGSQANGPTGNGTAICSDSSVTNCTVYNNGGSNYQVGGIWWSESSNITIRNNTVYNNKSDGIWAAYYARNYTISGNKVTGNQGNGIYLYDAAGTVVSGNTVTGNSARAIYSADGTGSVSGNVTN